MNTQSFRANQDRMRLALLWKALAYRVIAIAFTALFIGIKQSIEIHIGLTLLYYVFDLVWERARPHRATRQHTQDPEP